MTGPGIANTNKGLDRSFAILKYCMKIIKSFFVAY